MAKLTDLLKEMDAYDWKKVPDYKLLHPGHKSLVRDEWQDTLKEADITLNGLVLDVTCGPVSIGLIYNNVIGYDLDPSCIKEIRKKRIRGIIGDYRRLPFDDNTFDISVSFGTPSRPYNPKTIKCHKNVNLRALVDRVTSEMIRVTKKYVLLRNENYMTYAPKRFKKFIKKQNQYYILYDLNDQKKHKA